VPHERIRASPHANEIYLGFKNFAGTEKQLARKLYFEVISEALQPQEDEVVKRGLSIAGLAELVQHSMRELQREAVSHEHLLGLLATLKALVLCVVGDTKPDGR